MMAEKGLFTILTPAQAEIKEKGRRFIACVYSVPNPETVAEILKALRQQYRKAVHFCYAWRIGVEGQDYRANDDGEPGGTAGRPILGQIDHAQLTNTLVVVVRYFGGSLLGTGGLVQAYKQAAALGIEAAGKQLLATTITIKIRVPDRLLGQVHSLINRFAGKIVGTSYSNGHILTIEAEGENGRVLKHGLTGIYGVLPINGA